MSGQKVLISVPLGGDTLAARTMQAPGLVNAGTYGAQPPPIAHAGEWFRFFQVLDCSAAVRAARVLQIWAADVPVFYVGDISGRTNFCGGSLTSLSLRLLKP